MARCLATGLAIAIELLAGAARADDAPPPLVVDGAPVAVICGSSGKPTVLVAGPLGAPADATRALVDALATRGATVVAVALPADARRAIARVDQVTARVAELAHAPPVYCPIDEGSSLATIAVVVALGTAASATRDRCERSATVLVDPVVTDADVTRLAACASRGENTDVVVSSCPDAVREAWRIARAYQRMTTQNDRRPNVWQIPGCGAPDLVEPAFQQAIAATVKSPALGKLDTELTDLVIQHDLVEGEQVASHTSIAVAALIGGAVSGHIVLGLRPELIARRHGRGSFGIGGHLYFGNAVGQALELDKQQLFVPAMVGGGADAVIPIAAAGYDEEVVIEPSVGAYLGGHARLLGVGAMIGVRGTHNEFFGSEVPIGLRVDAWYDVETKRKDLTIALSADGIGLIAAGVLMVVWGAIAFGTK